jgi:hypothetical protein
VFGRVGVARFRRAVGGRDPCGQRDRARGGQRGRAAPLGRAALGVGPGERPRGQRPLLDDRFPAAPARSDRVTVCRDAAPGSGVESASRRSSHQDGGPGGDGQPARGQVTLQAPAPAVLFTTPGADPAAAPTLPGRAAHRHARVPGHEALLGKLSPLKNPPDPGIDHLGGKRRSPGNHLHLLTSPSGALPSAHSRGAARVLPPRSPCLSPRRRRSVASRPMRCSLG